MSIDYKALEDFLHGSRTRAYRSSVSLLDLYNYDNSVQQLISNPTVTGITSRDQIINPYDILNSDYYRNNASGRTQYQEDLNALLAIQAQQQASYDEWYNSATQQAVREREAGLNPNLSDSINAGEAASSELPSGSPFDGVPTNAELAGNIISSISGIVSSAASIAALPTSFAQARLAGVQASLVGAQASGQKLSNLQSFEGLIYSSAAGQFADAVASAAGSGVSFDVDKFFSDLPSSGLFEAYAPEDTPQYRAAYDRAIKQVQKIKGEGFKIGSSAAQNQTTFAEALSNPYFDSDVLLQLASLEPVMAAYEKLRILRRDYDTKILELSDPTLEASARNEKYKYESDYYKNFSGDRAAAADLLQKEAQAIISNCTASIHNNYLDIWKKDPTSSQGLGASYLILQGAHMTWYEFLAAFGLSNNLVAPEPVKDNGSPHSPYGVQNFGSSDSSNPTIPGTDIKVFPKGVHF